MSEASKARHGTGSTDSLGDWRERKAGPGSRRQGADREVDGSWMRGRDGEEERGGEERREGGVRERDGEREEGVLRASAGLSYVSPTTTRSPSLEAELPADSGGARSI